WPLPSPSGASVRPCSLRRRNGRRRAPRPRLLFPHATGQTASPHPSRHTSRLSLDRPGQRSLSPGRAPRAALARPSNRQVDGFDGRCALRFAHQTSPDVADLSDLAYSGTDADLVRTACHERSIARKLETLIAVLVGTLGLNDYVGGNWLPRQVDGEHASSPRQVARIDPALVRFSPPSAEGEAKTDAGSIGATL